MAGIDFYKLKSEDKQEIFQQIAIALNIHEAAVEKDWWVVQTLALILEMEVGPHIVFKGGTSLSKGWNLIERFSEDVDLALDRSFLGYADCPTVKQVKTLRSATRKYIYEKFIPELRESFTKARYTDVRIELNEEEGKNLEPVQISVNYSSHTASSAYTRSRVLIEMGSRSMRDPFSVRQFSSLVGEKYPNQPFADRPISIPTAKPERTFLEKLFLLHEEFQKPEKEIRVDRLSRHLYDIERLMGTEHFENALSNKEHYNEIILHRSIYTKISDIDYQLHQPLTINPIPPDAVLDGWRKDYQAMREEMIYGESLPFEKMLEKLKDLKKRINSIHWPEEG